MIAISALNRMASMYLLDVICLAVIIVVDDDDGDESDDDGLFDMMV